jgi:hypothetical protein
MCEYTDEELMAIIREGVAEHGLAAIKTINGVVDEAGDSLAPAASTPKLPYPVR